MLITVQLRDIYGRCLAYPMDGNARHLAAISGKSTLTAFVLREAIAMGMTIKLFDRFGSIVVNSANHPRLATLGQQ